MSQGVQLRQQTQTVLSGAGAATVKIGPQSHREAWTNCQVSVKTATAVTTGVCQANMYVGTDTSDSNFRDGTFSGDTGDSSGDALMGDIIHLPNQIIVSFTGGVANDVATVVVTGIKVLS